MRYGGCSRVLAAGNIEPLVPMSAFHEKGLAITGSGDGGGYRRHARRYFRTVRDGRYDLTRLFDVRCAAADPVVLARMAAGEVAPVKVLVEYDAG